MEHFMTSEEVAELLHVDPVTIRRLVTKKELSAYRIGADYRFAPSDLAHYLQRQRIVAHAQSQSESTPTHLLDSFTQGIRALLRGKHTTPEALLNHFDRFTEQARHVLLWAQEEAQSLQHRAIGTEHLLLGLLREKEGVAAVVLTQVGVEADQVRQTIETITGRGEQMVRGEMPLNPRTKKVFELAASEAQRLNHRLIGTGHLLLGLLLEGEGIAADILEQLGLHLEQVRTETVQALQKPNPEQEESPVLPADATMVQAEGEPELACASCGARCPGFFRYCFHCGHPLTQQDESSQGGPE